jgi:Zn-dependent protease with chaperone function
MNFFDAQQQAKASTSRLIIVFILGVGSFAASISMLILSIDHYLLTGKFIPKHFEEALFIRSFISVIFIVGMASFFQYFMLKDGGKVVALSLGGKLITRLSQEKSQQVLLNVVEEMSIASGISPPSVYLLSDRGINAFAAGFTYNDAVIGVTQGALDQLNREELQGVIAHEFSHIFNGDMRINLHLSGMVYGIVFIGAVGRFIVEALHDSHVDRYASHSSDNKKGGNPIVALYLLGLGLMVLGWIGTFIGEWIKAMISRQREYLADASAVQYTRYPQGIANALIKIGASSEGSSIRSSAGGTYAHLFFADGITNFWDHFFSTHPRLEDRIRRIDPSWNGKFVSKETKSPIRQNSSDNSSEAAFSPSTNLASALTSPIVIDTLSRIAQQPGNQNLKYARIRIDVLPDSLHTMCANALSAQWIIFTLLLSTENITLLKQEKYLKNISPMLYKNITSTYTKILDLPRSAHLDLINLSIPSLKMMSEQQYRVFRQTVIDLIEMDQVVSIWEWSLHAIVLTPLDREFGRSKPPRERYKKFEEIQEPLSVVFSLLIQTQFSNEKRINESIETLKTALSLPTLNYHTDVSLASLNKAFKEIQCSSNAVRTMVLEQAIHLLGSDGTHFDDDIEMIHALGSLLLIPLASIDIPT